MIELAALWAALGDIGDGNYPVPLILFADFIAGGIALGGQSFKEAPLHDEREVIEHRYIFCHGIIVVQASYLRIELTDDCDCVLVHQFSSMERFPPLFAVVVHNDFECLILF